MAVVALAVMLGPATAAGDGSLARPDAFNAADAASYYTFDACGDELAGRMYRRALAARVAECPFTPEARQAFASRARAQRAVSAAALQRLIDAHGGVPLRLDGMAQTCRENRDSADYRQFRDGLERFARGATTAAAVVPAACDADSVAP